MSMLRSFCLSCLLLCGVSTSVLAAGEEQAIRSKIQMAVPGTKIVSVRPSPMPGLYEVDIGNGIVYASPDGQFVIQGDLIQLKGRQGINLTEQAQAVKRVALLKQIDRRDEIIFPAKGKPRGVLTVFTDITCGYCRHFHQEVPALQAAGVEVRYMAFPRDFSRAGAQAGTTPRMATIWCSDNREQMLTQGLQGADIAPAGKECKAPIAAQYALALRMGVTGTPAIFNDKGELIGGYLSAQQALQALGLQ